MSAPRPRIHKEIRKALDATGLPWDMNLGTHHWKIRVAGRMAGILPRGPVRECPGKAVANTISQIRRAAREAKDDVQLLKH